MTWNDIEDILFDGTQEDIKALRCPGCDGKINTKYDAENNSLKVSCKSCGYNSILNGCESIPNCSMI
ncbi:MAG: hypothetical protein RSD17_07420 [Oscillospiraceae bacterium]